MKKYLKQYNFMIFVLGFVFFVSAGVSFNLYLSSRTQALENYHSKFRYALSLLERDVDDLKNQLDFSVMGLHQNQENGQFEFFTRGSGLMARHSRVAHREISIQFEGLKPFQSSIESISKGEYSLLNSRGDVLVSRTPHKKFLSNFEQVQELKKIDSSHANKINEFLILSSDGSFIGNHYSFSNFLKKSVVMWSKPVQGSDLYIVYAEDVQGYLPYLANVFLYSLLLFLPFAFAMLVVKKRVETAYVEIGKWVESTSDSLRYGRDVLLPNSNSIPIQAVSLLSSIQGAFSKNTHAQNYSGGDYISAEYNLVTWAYFKKTISLWLAGQKSDFDVQNGVDWIACSVSTARDSILDTFIREANGALLSKKMFIYQYSDNVIILAFRSTDFEESLERVKSLVKNSASRESFAAHDIFVDAVYSAKTECSFTDWFRFFESKIRKTNAIDNESLIKKEVVRFYMHSSLEKVLALNWIQLMAGIQNWLQLKAPESLKKDGPGAVIKPRSFSKPKFKNENGSKNNEIQIQSLK